MAKCRFCLRSNGLRSLLEEYKYRNTTEVYAKILAECFNMTMIIDTKSSDQICLKCVKRLRDAANFKALALEAENKLRDPLNFISKNNLIQKQFEEEIELHTDDGNIKYKLDFEDSVMDHDDDEESTQSEQDDENKICPLTVNGELTQDELALIDRFDFTKHNLNPVPLSFHRLVVEFTGKITAKDIETMMTEKEEEEQEEEEEPVEMVKEEPDEDEEIIELIEEKIEMMTEKDQEPSEVDEEKIALMKERPKAALIQEKKALMHNFNVLRKCSNITPFKTKTIFGVQCFYCREYKQDILELKQHCEELHKAESSVPIRLWRHGQSSLFINIDITALKCCLCNKKQESLKDLKTHLTLKHQKKFHKNFSDKIIPYVTSESDYHCQVCHLRFETFMGVKMHMNKHYCNYICETCGSGFITQCRLVTHVKNVHTGSSLTCPLCDKTYRSELRLKCHIDITHKRKKRYKCPYCGIRYKDYKVREQHMIETHDYEVKVFVCELCKQTFSRMGSLTRHKRKYHSLKK